MDKQYLYNKLEQANQKLIPLVTAENYDKLYNGLMEIAKVQGILSAYIEIEKNVSA